MRIERLSTGVGGLVLGAAAALLGAWTEPAAAQATNQRLFAGDGSSRAKAPVDPGKPGENPYGLQAAQQTIDKDQIEAYVTQVAGYRPDERIEESELVDMLDNFEKTYGVYVEDRDVLLVSGLNARSLVNALQNTLNNSVSIQVKTKRLAPANLPKQKHIVPKFQPETLPGLTDDPVDQPEETSSGQPLPQSRVRAENRQLENKIDYYSNGSQKDFGRKKDGTSKMSRSFHNPQAASSYQELEKRRQEARKNRFIPRDVRPESVGQRDEKAKEFYSNGLAKYDANGNELYANGRRKVSDAGVALYSNGRPKVDTFGNLVHSNGRRKATNDGRELFANGMPKVATDGVLLSRQGQRRLSADGRSPYGQGKPVFENDITMTKDGQLVDPNADPNRRTDVAEQSSARPLYASGRPMSTAEGEKLYPNGKRKYTGDGLGYSPFDENEDSADQGRKTELVKELYPNGKAAYSPDGKRLYANGKPRSNDEGVYLYKNGRKMVDNSQDLALTPTGEAVVGTQGFQGRPQGQFPIYQIVTGKIVKLDGKQLVVRPQGASDDLTVAIDRPYIAREANRAHLPGQFSQLVPQLAVTVVTRADTTFVDGDLVDQQSPAAAVAIFASNPRVGSAAADGQAEEVFVATGSVRGFREGDLILRDGTTGAELRFDVADTILQKERDGAITPADIRSIQPGMQARVIARRQVEYKAGKPTPAGNATALAVLQK